MLSQHARRGLSLRRASSFGSPCTSVRGYVVSRQWRPRRLLPSAESRLGHHPHERSLATAVDDFKYGATTYNHLSNNSLPPFSSPPRSTDLPTFDPSAPLIIGEAVPGPKGHSRQSRSGVPAELEDMLPVFDACLRVGKLDRAALILKRLASRDSIALVSAEEMILLNNQYLRASLNQMRTSPDTRQAEQLHKWYELQIRNANLPHTAETIACMLKASLLSERGTRLTRLVNRYMSMAPGEAGLRVLSMADILTDQDLAVITEICPTYNFAEEEEYESEAFGMEEVAEHSATLGELSEPHDAPTSAAEVKPTPQRGQGLTKLKKGLSLLHELEEVEISKLSDSDRREIQMQIERDAIDSALWGWRQESENMRKAGINSVMGSPSLNQYIAGWVTTMEEKLREEVKLIALSESKTLKSDRDLERCLYGPFITEADPSRLAAVTILSIMTAGTTLGPDKNVPVGRVVVQIGKLVQEDLQLQRSAKAKLKKNRKVGYKASTATTAAPQSDQIIPTQTIIPEPIRTDSLEQKSWGPVLLSQVGSILLKTLIESARIKVTRKHPTTGELIEQDQPAFSHSHIHKRGKKTGAISFNVELKEKLRKEPMGDFLAKHLPMVVPPKPWESFNKGGFLDAESSVVRVKPGDIEQRLYASEAIDRGDMDQVLKGLDILGKTAWKINKNVLNVMIEAWNTGESIANLPALDPDLPMPIEPDASADPMVRFRWAREVKAIENERTGLHSQRCYINLQLEIARAFRNQTMYFPHNLDYRGRAYPMPTYLNHMGADHTRSILVFAEGRELGQRGLRWLKIHLANLYGLDKASFDDREAFATNNMANILDSANNPLNGSKWWLQAEDPWQCLGACFELKAAYELADPTKYVSNLPVHQDGTCNGLQHYAALGGDTLGAQQVNLEPGEKPADVYTAVADLVKAGIAKDLAAGSAYAAAMNGKITRKVVKQTVMTNVYGVTFSGARKQVTRQIDALYPNLGKEVGIPNMLLGTYVVKHIFSALAAMFRGAHDIQYWLGEVGGRVTRALTPAQIEQLANGYDAGAASDQKASSQKRTYSDLQDQFCSTVVWTTPLRMPVVQPYRNSNTREIRTCVQTVKYTTSDRTCSVNRRKQLQGFPPNFIHSLDASHMLLSALKCDELGLSFAAVHDSFWTHAADIDRMNGVLRDAFISIHEEDVVGRLASEFEARHKGSIYLAHIDTRSPVALKIKELRKKSKLSPTEELLLEHKRMTLMMSEDPWDQEAAKQIVTPATVYQDMKALEKDVTTLLETQEFALGAMPGVKTAPADTTSDEALAAGEDAGANDGLLPSAPETDEAHAGDAEEHESLAFKEVSIAGFDAVLTDRVQKAPQTVHLPLWLPLTIPPVPVKGDFNVTRLRGSKYFFS